MTVVSNRDITSWLSERLYILLQRISYWTSVFLGGLKRYLTQGLRGLDRPQVSLGWVSVVYGVLLGLIEWPLSLRSRTICERWSRTVNLLKFEIDTICSAVWFAPTKEKLTWLPLPTKNSWVRNCQWQFGWSGLRYFVGNIFIFLVAGHEVRISGSWRSFIWSSCYRLLRILSHSLWVCWPFTLISKKNCLIISSKSFPRVVDPWVPLHRSIKYPLTPGLILVLRRYTKPNICNGVRKICRFLDFSLEGV